MEGWPAAAPALSCGHWPFSMARSCTLQHAAAAQPASPHGRARRYTLAAADPCWRCMPSKRMPCSYVRCASPHRVASRNCAKVSMPAASSGAGWCAAQRRACLQPAAGQVGVPRRGEHACSLQRAVGVPRRGEHACSLQRARHAVCAQGFWSGGADAGSQAPVPQLAGDPGCNAPPPAPHRQQHAEKPASPATCRHQHAARRPSCCTPSHQNTCLGSRRGTAPRLPGSRWWTGT